MKNFISAFSIFLLLTIILSTNSAKAQSSSPTDAWRLGIGLETGVPTGAISNSTNFDLGATARLQYGITSKFALTLTSGYYDMLGKNYSQTVVLPGTPTPTTLTISGKYGKVGTIPIKVGVKYFVAPSLYVNGEAGVGILTGPYSYSKLILSPGLGYASKTWDLGLRYENFSSTTYQSYGLVALRLAYGFGL